MTRGNAGEYTIPKDKLVTINMNDIYQLNHLKIPNNTIRIIDIKSGNTNMVITLQKSYNINDLKSSTKNNHLKFYKMGGDEYTTTTDPLIKKHTKFIISNDDDTNRTFQVDCHLTIHSDLVNTQFYRNISEMISTTDYVGTGWTLVGRVTENIDNRWDDIINNFDTEDTIKEDIFIGDEDIDDKDKDEKHSIFNNKNSKYCFKRSSKSVNLSDYNEILIGTSNEVIQSDGSRLPTKWGVYMIRMNFLGL